MIEPLTSELPPLSLLVDPLLDRERGALTIGLTCVVYCSVGDTAGDLINPLNSCSTHIL